MDEYLDSILEIGPLGHLRWLTLGCRQLRFYATQENPSKSLVILAEFCIKVYFPSWFLIKSRPTLTDGARNFFFMVRTASQFPKADVKNIALKVLENNAYFAHPEMVTLAMMEDESDTVRDQAVSNILQFRQHATQTRNTNNQKKKANKTTYYRDKSVRKCVLPPINSNALCNQELVNVSL